MVPGIYRSSIGWNSGFLSSEPQKDPLRIHVFSRGFLLPLWVEWADVGGVFAARGHNDGHTMTARDYVAVWLTDSGARQLLGLPASQEPSRWVARGRFKEHESHVGIWLALDEVEERRPQGKRVKYAVTPPVCLLRWEFIITAQLAKKGVEVIGYEISSQ